MEKKTKERNRKRFFRSVHSGSYVEKNMNKHAFLLCLTHTTRKRNNLYKEHKHKKETQNEREHNEYKIAGKKKMRNQNWANRKEENKTHNFYRPVNGFENKIEQANERIYSKKRGMKETNRPTTKEMKKKKEQRSGETENACMLVNNTMYKIYIQCVCASETTISNRNGKGNGSNYF